MEHQTDEELARRAVVGEEAAFTALIRRHEGLLVSIIRRTVGDADHAEDVLQETRLAAWLEFPNLREPQRVLGLLIRIARRRAMDHLRSPARRHQPVEPMIIEERANRHVMANWAAMRGGLELRDALRILPNETRRIVHLFYLFGYSIREIATRTGRPEGTIKRHLHEGRQTLRHLFVLPSEQCKQKEIRAMSTHQNPPKETPRQMAEPHPFPAIRPVIEIVPAPEPGFAVDCRELRSWFIVPEPEQQILWAMYDPPDWCLTTVMHVVAAGPSKVHGLPCVRLQSTEWTPETKQFKEHLQLFARLTEDGVQCLATLGRQGETVSLESFLDEGYEDKWWISERHLADKGEMREQPDGSFRIESARDRGSFAAGVFTVRTGQRAYTCLRVFDFEEIASDKSLAMEQYITREGRTILCRRYNARNWNYGRALPPERPWNEQLPDAARMIVNGNVFVHWYDCLSAGALETC